MVLLFRQRAIIDLDINLGELAMNYAIIANLELKISVQAKIKCAQNKFEQKPAYKNMFELEYTNAMQVSLGGSLNWLSNNNKIRLQTNEMEQAD